ncbi:hypothetical protein NDI56_17615 [Haloarcula sp. S1CR25-12]|uniref:DUF6788 domain-containing protein n=1 Tax=Haloarcula saliterrae TaxID=2950534 RepID=A0ABU2FG45_9EURY|nr:hypothetical protein [Haloarcula sp. S1CR25-12]MDS0261221.1 hypothetical protein [Haloarcula sp. S1CR25-12]
MSDRDRAVEALERLRAMEPFDGGESTIERHRQEAIRHVTTLVAELEQSDQSGTADDSVETPDGWEDGDAWEDKVETAREKAAIPPSKGTLTTKTIKGREYYYLQWRDGEKVKSQYVAPVDPA